MQTVTMDDLGHVLLALTIATQDMHIRRNNATDMFPYEDGSLESRLPYRKSVQNSSVSTLDLLSLYYV